MCKTLSKKFILVTTLVSMVFNQVAWADSQSLPIANSNSAGAATSATTFSSEDAVRAVAKLSPLSSIETEVNRAVAKSDGASKAFLKNAGVGLLQGITSLLVLTVADQIRIKIHERHLNMDKRILPKLGEEAVRTLTVQQQFFYQSMDAALNQPALLASGAILSAILKPIVNHLINQENFQAFLASAAVGALLSFGVEGITEMMAFSIKSVVEEPLTQFKLTPTQLGFMKYLAAPENYSTSFLLAGIWSKDPDRKVVSNIIFKRILSRFWNDQGFRHAFYSSWMRNRLTGSTAVKLGSLLLTRWAYIQITSAIVAAGAAAVGTAAEPGGGTAVGGGIGLGAGFMIGLGLSSVVGFGMGSVSDYEKDALTYYIRRSYLGLSSLGAAASDSLTHQWILHGNRTEEDAQILNAYVDFESMQSQRENQVINQLDLIKTAITRLDALQLDLYYAQAQHEALRQKGTWEYIKSELAVELKSLPRTFLLMPAEPFLIEGIKKDEKLIEVYKAAFDEFTLNVLNTFDQDIERLRVTSTSTRDGGIKYFAAHETKDLIQFRKFYATLFSWLKSGIDSWQITPNYLAARQTIDRLTFWNWKESDLKTRLSIH